MLTFLNTILKKSVKEIAKDLGKNTANDIALTPVKNLWKKIKSAMKKGGYGKIKVTKYMKSRRKGKYKTTINEPISKTKMVYTNVRNITFYYRSYSSKYMQL